MPQLRIQGLRKAVRPASLEEAVLDSLSDFVAKAGLALGDRLPSERELCAALDVGRSTVREALKRWQALGIIERRQGSGIYLRAKVGPNIVHIPIPLALPRKAKVRDLLHILEVRRALEGEAAAACAARASKATIDAIGKALERLEKDHAAGDGSKADWAFHLKIFHSTGNGYFPQMIQSMRELLHQLWDNALELPDFAAASHPYHRTMYEAIRRRDPGAARAEAWKLVDSVAQEIREAFPHES